MLRVSGPRAAGVGKECCRAPGEDPLILAERGAQEVRFHDGVGWLPCLAVWMPGPRSFTAEDVLELHLPGHVDLAQGALERVLAAGAVLAEPGEFTRRAFENGRIDLTRAEGVLALIHARTTGERRAASALLAGGHVLLEGVPGLGKTMLVSSLGEALKLSFSRIQFTPDMMPADVRGTSVLVESEGGGHELQFEQGPIVANLVLADEINRATPKTQSALLEAMQERQLTIGRRTIKLEEPFCVMATQNPVEQEGTYPLPEAQLDRFLFKLVVGYPEEGDYREILRRTTGEQEVELSSVSNAETINAMRSTVRQVPVPEHAEDYAIRAGDRIAQAVVARHETLRFVCTDALPATDRGEGGFGHTGR